MVPMVKCRRRDQPFHGTEAPADIGVDEEAPDRDDQHHHRCNQRALHALRRTKTENVDRDQAAEPDEHEVDGMGARTDQEVDVLRFVVDCVETPQEGDFMGPAMAPVEADLADDKGGHATQP